MVQQAISKVRKLEDEVRRLRGLIESFSIGGQIKPGVIAGGVQLPLPIEGAILYGTGVPDWARLAPPASGDDYKLSYLDGDNAPSWQLDDASLPPGGTTGQGLLKDSGADGDATWHDIEDFATAETDDTLRLAPDGVGGVEWVASGGGGITAVRTYISFGVNESGQSYTP